jgi:ABC-type Fe3+/spermidine/putrescine transport system ATPase subunit
MLEVNHLQFSYPNQQPAVNEISFEVQTGEHIALIGESGCGKSSLLHLIFGKLQPNSGSVVWNGKNVQGPMQKLIPGEEDVKLLTQEFDLMPFISVEQNITKYLSRMYPERNHQRCNELLEVVDLVGYGDRMVKDLSGGQKQRVAIAQCLANQPKLLLMDEPFSHIDQFKKNKLRRRLFRFLKKENITCIFATHDPKDMLHFSDKTLVMSQAKRIDFRSPQQLYENPKKELVASLFEETNIVSSHFLGDDAPNGKFLYYPHEIQILEQASPSSHKARIKHSFFQGNNYLNEIETSKKLKLLVESTLTYKTGKEVHVEFSKIDFEQRKIT